MPRALAVHVRLHDGRYHGEGDWPPCPARLFQALVAGAGLGDRIEEVADALGWLERQPPPLIGAPLARRGQRVMFYMPNNDMDAVGGNPHRVAEIRTAKKFFSPWLFDAEIPFLYLWQDVPDQDAEHASAIRSLADRLYQLGRGIDMAWAWADVLDVPEVDGLLAGYPGRVQYPAPGVGGNGGCVLLCPHPGSFESICTRHRAHRRRFDVERRGRTLTSAFRQAPRSSFHPVAYDSRPSRILFDLCTFSGESSFAPWPLSGASRFVVCLRDGAVERLQSALPDRREEIERVLAGRRPDGTHAGPTAERVRIVPLPSIGHPNADRAIRRVLVEVPAACPFWAEDVAWAFSGLEPLDVVTGEVYPIVLTRAPDESMLRHYGIGESTGARTWRTVTPVVLPETAGRRRIEPTRKLAEAKTGAERVQEQRYAAGAVVQALRHAEVGVTPVSIHVRREPFAGRGQRAESFAVGTRFRKERLWHVEIVFAGTVEGPILIGDGRFLGLGLMAPVQESVSAT